MTNKYSEGYPGARYYGGNEVIDEIELLAQKRTLAAYGLDGNEWGCNVQAFSGCPANFAIYTALIPPGERLMGMSLSEGGHLSHGFYTPTRKVSATSLFWESKQYHCNKETMLIDYDALLREAKEFKPTMIIAGASAYPREIEYNRFREICDEVGALLLADICHVSGLIASGKQNRPFDYADVVMSTSHKSLQGPRSSFIFSKKDERNLPQKINDAVFPGLQGGPHNQKIGALATHMKTVNSPEFVAYQQQILDNAQALSKELIARGQTLITGGTSNHLMLINVKAAGLTGSKVEKLCDSLHITLNKNTIVGDKSATTPGGVRVGTPAITTRGYLEQDAKEVGRFLDEAIKLSVELQTRAGSKKLKDFVTQIEESNEVK